MYSTTDYELKKRGDVGSWVREAAMLSLEEVATLASAAQAQRITSGVMAGDTEVLWSEVMATELAQALVRQVHEKIDRMRSLAARAHEKIDRLRSLAAGVLGRIASSKSEGHYY
ncbi:hypothetical protein T492DRAFT_841499 [Pavlovales sp. CCMP2436]|nr:hypothetical protein T492DRAFT_841499 [Pavlovales sp. CCMP2436]